jgi:hypothetical protein
MATQDMDTRRSQVIHRLQQSGFTPPMSAQILSMVDSIMTGHTPLAHVLVAAAEVCGVCGLGKTHQHVADALTCLAGEVLLLQTPSLNDDSAAPHHKEASSVYWNHKRQARAEQRLA